MADPDLQIRESAGGEGQGGGHPDPEVRGIGSPSGLTVVWSKNKEDAAGPSPGFASYGMDKLGKIRQHR